MGKKAKYSLDGFLERVKCLNTNFGFVDVWEKLTVHQIEESRNSDLNTASLVDDVNRQTYINTHHQYDSG